jgi:GT2 family glycosyltransferase
MNRGIEAATGEFVALLNLDVVLEPAYLARCAAALAADPRLGGVTGKLRRPGDASPAILDTTGHTVFRNRRAVDRGERERDNGQYDAATELFSVCAAASCYRKAMLEDVAVNGEYFDDDFFMYFEDFDLSWRAQLRGWHFAFVPDAIGTHFRGGSGGKASTAILACNHRNRLLVMLHNDSPASFLKHFPGIAYTEVRATLHMLLRRPAALVLAWWQFFRLLPRHYGRRRAIQRHRQVGWRELEPSFLPYEYGVGPALRRARERREVR